MSCATNKPTCSAAARERELYRYYQPDEAANINFENAAERRSSSDPILTAFAQLGALRLNKRRGIIGLGSCAAEYIIAEAGPSLSLQKDNDDNDMLWHGIGALGCHPDQKDKKSLSTYFYETGADILIVDDMRTQAPFNEWRNVHQPPFARSLAAVPLRTPNNVVIGVYMVMDIEVMEGLKEEEQQFLHDMAVTVVDYLQGGLVKRKQHRAETMIKALGLFIEGKSTIREWWLAYGHKGNHGHKKRSSKSVSLEVLADQEFGVQDRTDTFSSAIFRPQRPILSRAPSSNAQSAAETDDYGDGRPHMSRGESHESNTESSLPVGRSMSSVYEHERQESVTSVETHSVTFDVPEHPNSIEVQPNLQDAVVSGDLRSVFARASNLIREACSVDGVVYYDASIGSFGGSANESAMSEKAPGAFVVENGNSDDGNESNGVKSDNAAPVVAPTSGSESESSKGKSCNILGYSTRNRSSLNGHSPLEQHRKFPESALRRMTKKYPHGKLFNFDENGHLSSDSDDMSTSADEARTPEGETPPAVRRPKRKTRVAETESLLHVFPGARSIFFYPLWDSSRNKWYSGSFIWSTSPTRVLCPLEDLVYLASFGNSIMAEVTRISQQALAQMKTDFIASISHELRSPLHGVLASVEFLQETTLDEMQTEMVDNINASGKVLLDTINHVLDFSKVNRKDNKTSRFSKRAAKRLKKQRTKGIASDKPDDDLPNICQFSEEVIESVYAGHRVKKHAFGSHSETDLTATAEAPVSVIVDIAWRPDWTFDLDSGAWRRILMNLFNNAMKYTTSGFVKVALSVEEESSSRSRMRSRTLVLKVSDSGKGISEEFLKHQLYRPFAQEDGLSSGAGLGLSIIRQIIQDLGGRISINSESGSGTEAVVKIPLPQTEAQSTLDATNISEARKLTTDLTYALEGFERYPDISEEPTGILPSDIQAAMYLKAATSTVLNDWFCMKPCSVSTATESPSLPDVVVVSEAGLAKHSLADVLQPYGRPTPIGSRKPVAIVLCSTYHPTVRVEHHQFFDVFHMQQPYGPNKLASLLTKVLQGAPEDHRSATDPGSLHPELHIRPSSMRGTSQPTLLSNMTMSPLSTTIPANTFHNGVRPQSARLWSKELPVQSSGLWSPKTPESKSVLPVEKPVEQQPSENTAPVPATSCEGLRVLLVEDNEINLKLLVAYMRKLKLAHATAGNGLEALNAYKSHDGRHDVIFMDISMPIMDGIESSRNIRRFERENSLPPTALIALTGAANPNARQEAFSSGVDLFLTKPVAMKSLKVMLEDIRRDGRSVLKGEGYEL